LAIQELEEADEFILIDERSTGIPSQHLPKSLDGGIVDHVAA
jgi:hypothetical protein